MCERVRFRQQQLKHITKAFHFHILEKKIRVNSQLFLRDGKSLAVVGCSTDKYSCSIDRLRRHNKFLNKRNSMSTKTEKISTLVVD